MTSRRATVIFGLAITAVLLVYVLRIDPVAGLFVDDAWYMVLAEAIASGRGYRLISSAAAQVLPAVPPGFPLVLAPIVAMVPRFPDYVIWMKLLSVAATLTAGAICWRDFVRHREIPAADGTLIVVASLLTPALVFLATSAVMAEGVFMLALVGSVIAVERITRRDAREVTAPIAAAVVVAVAMLIRTTAVAVIAAAFAHLLIARRWRQAAIFAAALAVSLLPWQLYASTHASTEEERASHGGSMAATYSQLMTSERLSDPGRAASFGVLLGRVTDNLRVVFTRDVGAIIVPALYRGPDESGEEVFSIGREGLGNMGVATGTMLASILLTIIALAGWLAWPEQRWAVPGLLLAATVPMVAAVPAQTFRYFVPLAPYVLMFVWRGLRSPRLGRGALLIVIGLHALDHSAYIHLKFTGTPKWIADWQDNTELLTWARQNVPADQAIVTTNPGLVYLATGRRTVAIDNWQRNWQRWKTAGFRYLASTRPHDDLPSRSLGWRQVFKSGRGGLWIVEIDND